MRLATRHRCRFRWSDDYRCYEGGDGKPKRKACPRDGAEWVIENGVWAVFVWNNERHYPIADAVAVRLTEAAARRFVDQHPDQNYVDRWVPANEIPELEP